MCFHYTLLFPSPVFFSTVIGKPVKAFWETWPRSEGKASRQEILKCISFTFFFSLFFFFFFCNGSSDWVGVKPQPQRVAGAVLFSHLLPLRRHPTSVPDAHLAGMLKFNVDESWLTSWEINVTYQPESSCSSGWNLIFHSSFFAGGGVWIVVYAIGLGNMAYKQYLDIFRISCFILYISKHIFRP